MAVVCVACAVVSVACAKQPNIVIVLADDMGYSDIGCYGGEIRTPNLDTMASEGLRFTQFYNTGRCCPTRASLLTGLYPHQAGIGHMTSESGLPGYMGRLNDQSVTIAEVLKEGGYKTGAFGKWHVTYFDYKTLEASHRDSWPLQRGFDRFVGSLAGGGNYYDPKGWMEGNEFKQPEDGFYYTDVVSDSAVNFIEQSDGDEPLFLYVAFTAPHWPLHALSEDIEKYKGVYDVGWDAVREERYKRMVEMGLVKKEWALSDRDKRVKEWSDKIPDKEWHSHQMATYAAMIERMDQGIGRIRKALKDTGRDSNTLMFFLSDNGGCEESVRMPSIKQFATKGQKTDNWGNQKDVMAGPPETFQSYGIHWANASNTPYRWYKSEVHEGGISTPLVVHWPKGISEEVRGTLEHRPGHVVDLMVTCVDVAEVNYPKNYKQRVVQAMEGKSLAAAFNNEIIQQRRLLFFAHEGNRAVRDDKWKLVRIQNRAWELYDLERDRTEMNDLADEQPDRVKELATQWQEWAERTNVIPGPYDK